MNSTALTWRCCLNLKNRLPGISASGINGGILEYGTWTLSTGGGAGGQIIVISTRLEVHCEEQEQCKAPKLIAKGGRAQCIAKSPAVGGAGGGGFIGLQRNSTTIEDIELDAWMAFTKTQHPLAAVWVLQAIESL